MLSRLLYDDMPLYVALFSSGVLSGSVSWYTSSDYNSAYDCVINESQDTGISLLGANIYPDRARIYNGAGYLPGTATNTFSTPSAAANQFTGGIEMVVDLSMPNWVPATDGFLFGKYNSSTSNRSYMITVNSTGVFAFAVSADGASLTTVTSSAHGLSAGARKALKVVFVPSTSVTFYLSDDRVNWTLLSTTAIGVASIFAGNAPVTIGARADVTFPLTQATIYYAGIRQLGAGSDTVIFDPSLVQNFAYGFKSSSGEMWDVNVSAAYDTSWQYKVQPLQLGSAGIYTNARKWYECLYLPGTSGNYATMPHSAAFDATGDIDMLAYIIPADWTPADYKTIVAKRSGSNYPYQLRMDTASSGKLQFSWAVSGVSYIAVSSVSTGFLDGTGAWVRVTRTLNGANQEVRFYYSRESGMTDVSSITWTQLGTTQIIASAAPSSTTADLFIGYDNANPTWNFNGQICRVVLKALGGSTLFDFKPSVVQDLAISIPDNVFAGTWTVIKTATSDTNDPKYLPYSGQKYAYLPGVTGNHISAPDAAANRITSDFSIVSRISVADYTPASPIAIFGKSQDSATVSYRMDINVGGGILLYTSPDGTVANRIARTSSVAIPASDGQTCWIRVDMDVDNGASGNTATFYYSFTNTNDPSLVSWTQLGTPQVVAGVTSIFSGSAPVLIGSTNGGTSNNWEGNVLYSALYSGIMGTQVVKFDASLCDQTGYTDTLNSTVWTVNRSSTGKKTVIVDRASFVLGTDDYFITQNHPLINIGVSDSFSVFATARTFGSQASGYAGFISKGTATPSSAGWAVYPNLVAQSVYLELYDGTTAASANAGLIVPTAGTTWIGGGVRDVVADTITSYSASVASTPTTDTTTATLANNSNPLYIGRRVQGTPTYWEGEFFGFAFIRRTVNGSEVAYLKTQLNGN